MSTKRSTKKLEPLLIKVIVYDIATGEAIREHETDFNNPKCCEWLTRLMLWAFQNGKSVEIFNIKEEAA